MDFKRLQQSKKVHGIFIGVLAVIGVLAIFQAGVFVGYHKASFSYGLGEGYYRTFEGRGPGGMFGLPPRNLPGGDSAVGTIVRVALPTVVIASPDAIEKSITITSDTRIRQFREEVASTSLSVGDEVLVLGSPTKEGTIDAQLIRIMPPAGGRGMMMFDER